MRTIGSLIATLSTAAAAPCFAGVAAARVIRGGLLLAAVGTALAAADPASAQPSACPAADRTYTGKCGPPNPLVRSASGAEPAVVAVWALADGDTPLAGAHVRIVKGGTVLRQDNGTRREVTSRAGVSLLDLGRLPRRFIVEVVPRRRLGGTFRALVRRYRAGAVVHVNPVTTLIADVLAAHRRRGRPVRFARARREVFRLLGIRRWQDQADLRYRDAAFDGDTYLRAARRAGGVAALNRSLVRRVFRDEGRRRFRHARRNARAAASFDFEQVFGNLVKFAGTSVAEVAAKKGGEVVLGFLLAGFGFSDDQQLTQQQLKEIQASLDAIGKQLTQLQNDVALAGFSTLVHQRDQSIGEIDFAASRLDMLARIPAGDPTKRAFAQTVVDYIGSHLLDEPDILNQSLASSAPLADNLIKSASRLVKTRSGRFFDTTASAQARSVYDYFAAYEARLAVMLTEYFHARPDIYSPATTEAEVRRLQAMVVEQARSVKPAVPSGAVMDTQTGLMWTQDFKRHSMSDFAQIDTPEKYPGRFEWLARSFGLPGLPFNNWSLPTHEQVQGLIAGWSNVCCSLGWLQTVGGFGTMTAPPILYTTEDAVAFNLRQDSVDVGVRVYDFLHDDFRYEVLRMYGFKREDYPTFVAGAMRQWVLTAIEVRKPAPGETYWWQ